ncbi:Helix-turn-helix domain-containing protein [Mucilaginibacter pineti]|uniref:Helix-turn-helix domain-containing protein n=1 Tax=Mucilaginibacter pineti TaxID=1391627 RepID=A0A1G7H472_9SPHI|nr:helix-turn-helix domain-containing protein [Mucilaginibacter pineti]SDE94929.1 Helix-turn-helix domain-containing protein [Mucilaginibacter pineti]
MQLNIITLEDLLQFKTELFTEMNRLLQGGKESQTKQWLMSAEVRKMLNISPGTLQNLRISGTLPYRKIGGSMFYNREEIEKIMRGE